MQETAVQERVRLPDTSWRPADNDPVNLFKACVLTPDRHGQFIKSLCEKEGKNSIELTPTGVWQLISSWIALQREDFLDWLPSEHGGRRKPGHTPQFALRATLLCIPAEECMTNEALPFVWDLRAYAQDPAHEIVPLQAGSEHQPFLNREGVLSLQQLSLQPDLDITDQMINGMETHAMLGRGRAVALCLATPSESIDAGGKSFASCIHFER